MKTDLQLQQDVAAELRWDPRIQDKEIAVAARDGVVTLRGAVRSYGEKLEAERAAERLYGVKAVANDLEVRLPTLTERSDTEIAHAVINVLEWDAEVPHEKIKARVENGVVTLDGMVDWYFEKIAAERAVQYLIGVKRVINNITVQPQVQTTDVADNIRDALKRSAEVEANRITVETADGKVTLRGTVRSYAERAAAERAAWDAPGVKEVDDRLAVLL